MATRGEQRALMRRLHRRSLDLFKASEHMSQLGHEDIAAQLAAQAEKDLAESNRLDRELYSIKGPVGPTG